MGRTTDQVSQFRQLIWPYVQFTDLSCFFQFCFASLTCLVCGYMEHASNIVRIMYKNSLFDLFICVFDLVLNMFLPDGLLHGSILDWL